MGGDPISLLTIAGTVVQGAQQFMAAGAEGRAAQQQADFETRQLEMEIQRERAQAAMETRDREERLRVALARQRAAFGSSGFDAQSNSFIRLQEETAGSSNKEQGRADFVSSQNVLNLNVGKEQTRIGNAYTQKATTSKKIGVVTDTAFSTGRILKGSSLLKKGTETWDNGDPLRRY